MFGYILGIYFSCIKHSAVKHQPREESILPSGPWTEVATDLFSYKGEIYLLVVDYYTRWIETRLLSTQTAKAVIMSLQDIFSIFGVPKTVRSDNGPCYSATIFSQFAEEWGFSHVTSSPRYPQSNGMAERAVGTVKRLWGRSVNQCLAMLAYRTTPLSSGFSPGDLMFGRNIRSDMGIQGVPNSVDYDLFVQKENELRDLDHEKWDRKYRVHELPMLTEGERVWVKAPSDPGREGVVLRKDSNPQSYWVRVGNCDVRRNRKHLFSLKHAQNNGTDRDEGNYTNLLQDDDNEPLGNTVEVPRDAVTQDLQRDALEREEPSVSSHTESPNLGDNTSGMEDYNGELTNMTNSHAPVVLPVSYEMGINGEHDRASGDLGQTQVEIAPQGDPLGSDQNINQEKPHVGTSRETITVSGRISKPYRIADCLYY